MVIALPKLAFSPGRIFCLHVPHHLHVDSADIEQEVLELANQHGKSAGICRPATTRRGFREFFRRQRAAEWLAQAARISRREAAQAIASFGVPVHEILALNPGTPRCLLGVAALLRQMPDVIIYSTVGLDPLGIMAVHRLVCPNSIGECAVHLSFPAVFGDGSPAPRYCPENSLCSDYGSLAEQRVAPDCGGIK